MFKHLKKNILGGKWAFTAYLLYGGFLMFLLFQTVHDRTEKELELRKLNNLPPYQRFIALIVTGNDENVLEKESLRFKNFIEKTLEGKILGPVNAPIFRLKKKFRIRLLVRGKKSLKVQSSLTKIISKFKFASGLKLTVDVDPINFN